MHLRSGARVVTYLMPVDGRCHGCSCWLSSGLALQGMVVHCIQVVLLAPLTLCDLGLCDKIEWPNFFFDMLLN